jgi:hypothetical protein
MSRAVSMAGPDRPTAPGRPSSHPAGSLDVPWHLVQEYENTICSAGTPAAARPPWSRSSGRPSQRAARLAAASRGAAASWPGCPTTRPARREIRRLAAPVLPFGDLPPQHLLPQLVPVTVDAADSLEHRLYAGSCSASRRTRSMPVAWTTPSISSRSPRRPAAGAPGSESRAVAAPGSAVPGSLASGIPASA